MLAQETNPKFHFTRELNFEYEKTSDAFTDAMFLTLNGAYHAEKFILEIAIDTNFYLPYL